MKYIFNLVLLVFLVYNVTNAQSRLIVRELRPADPGSIQFVMGAGSSTIIKDSKNNWESIVGPSISIYYFPDGMEHSPVKMFSEIGYISRGAKNKKGNANLKYLDFALALRGQIFLKHSTPSFNAGWNFALLVSGKSEFEKICPRNQSGYLDIESYNSCGWFVGVGYEFVRSSEQTSREVVGFELRYARSFGGNWNIFSSGGNHELISARIIIPIFHYNG